MLQIDPLSRQPVYEQLIEQLERLVLLDLLTGDTQLPSVRSLSLELSVNPNTIQKAYSELDVRGIIYSVPGIGCFVSGDAKEKLLQHKRKKITQLHALAEELALAGIAKEELLQCIEAVYTEREVTYDSRRKSDETV